MKERCPVCGTAFEVGNFAASLLSIPEVASLRVACPVCSTEFASDPVPEPYDAGPIADDDVLASWHRDQTRGIPVDRLPRYDFARRLWTAYNEPVESYEAATARIDNVKAGLCPDGTRLGWLDFFLNPADPDDEGAETLRPGRDLAASWGRGPDLFVAA